MVATNYPLYLFFLRLVHLVGGNDENASCLLLFCSVGVEKNHIHPLQLHLEEYIISIQDCHKVDFPCMNGSFGCVPSVEVYQGEIIVHARVVEKYEKCSRCFIV